MIHIVDEAPAHVGAREALLDLSFGFDRHQKTSERLREGRLPAFAYSALDEDGELVGTVRLWPVSDGTGQGSLMLGPLAVAKTCQGQRIGDRLMRHALTQAALAGHGSVLLVGDLAYYERFGFARGLLDGVVLPGPLERERFLGLEFTSGHLERLSGCLAGAGQIDPVAALGLPSVDLPYHKVA
ncbi:GNAT family N-acetyltransferase [Roseibium aggregatum]|uniref:N-acetyltransferase n=1 Tax=Roseibium aggregatum TaxID=187304 RepID=A0A926S8L6_9HYPH|nr:N-acetyltransferase [Roseibium aggregatum]MBD1545139.1 N-acetyltransferase [Roseibium aggregatum]